MINKKKPAAKIAEPTKKRMPRGRPKCQPTKKRMPRGRPKCQPTIDQFSRNIAAIGTKQLLTIFDIDGCIADDSWRFQFVQRDGECNDEKYHAYHSASNLDERLSSGHEVFQRAHAAGFFPIFITARPEAYRSITESWLAAQLGITVGTDAALFMRRDRDPKTSVEVKRKIVEEMSKVIHLRRIVAAYDDREDIASMYFNAFDINAYKLDANGVHDFLGVQESRAPGIAPMKSRAIVRGTLGQCVDDVEAASVVDDMQAYIQEHGTSESEVLGQDTFNRLAAYGRKEGGPVDPNAVDYDVVPMILKSMATTFEERAQVYGNDCARAGRVMQVLFPEGYTATSAADHAMMGHFERVIAKLTRFASSGLKHVDSIHDLAAYAAICEAEVDGHNIIFPGA
jgi:hypothetical protein